LTLSGCGGGGGVEAEYGRVRGRSINGTGAFAQMLRDRGHTVRVTSRLNDQVKEWADTVIRFAPFPGPPGQKEAEWYESWLMEDPARALVYIPRDFDAESEYWTQVLAHLPATATERFRKDAEKRRAETASWASGLPSAVKTHAGNQLTFNLESNPKPPSACKNLTGPWAEDIDIKKAGITRHQGIRSAANQEVLLKGDDDILVMQMKPYYGGAVLVVANGSFLLNEPLVNPERRLLALNLLEWLGDDGRNIVFVESTTPRENGLQGRGSLLAPLRVYPTGWVIAQWLGFMLLLVLSAAAILGRPRTDPPAGEDRPVAHAEALGDLLRRSGDAETARDLLAAYRRWRHPASDGARRVRQM
jgi:hypothetical protein